MMLVFDALDLTFKNHFQIMDNGKKWGLSPNSVLGRFLIINANIYANSEIIKTLVIAKIWL